MVLFRTLRSSFATFFKTGPRSSKYGEPYSLDSFWFVTQSLPFVGEGMRDEPLRTRRLRNWMPLISYPVDSAIQPLNNQSLGTTLAPRYMKGCHGDFVISHVKIQINAEKWR